MSSFDFQVKCKKHNRKVSYYGEGLTPMRNGLADFYCDYADLYCVPSDYDGESEIDECQEHWYTEGPILYGA